MVDYSTDKKYDLFGLFYSIWMFTAIMGTSLYIYNFSVCYKLFLAIRTICIWGIVCQSLPKMKNHKIKISALVLLVFVLVAYYSFSKYWQVTIAEGIVIAFLGRDKDMVEICRISTSVLIIALLFVICSSYLKIIPNYDFSVGERRQRLGLGFSYTTYSSHYVLLLAMAVVYGKKQNVRIIELLFILIVDLFVFWKTDSKNSFILTIIVVIVAFIYKRSQFDIPYNAFTRIIISGLFIILTIVTIVLAVLYNESNEIMVALNQAFSNRLYLNWHAFQTYDITLFGQITEFATRAWRNGEYVHVSNTYTGMDSSYLDILFRNGLCVLLFMLYGFTKATDNALKDKDRYLVLMMLTIAVHSAVDPQLSHLYYNIFIFSVMKVMSSKKKMFESTKPL